LKIRLKHNSVVIEIPENSKYFNLISSNMPSNKAQKEKREEFLKAIYYMCVHNVQYQNPKFLKNLMKSSFKNIELLVKGRIYVEKKCVHEKQHAILNSSKYDSLHVIRKKYLKLAKIYHPDKVANLDVGLLKVYTHKFQQIQAAYEVLKYKAAS